MLGPTASTGELLTEQDAPSLSPAQPASTGGRASRLSASGFTLYAGFCTPAENMALQTTGFAKKKKKKVTYPLTVHGLGWGGPHLVDPKSVIRAMEADRCQDICNPNSASGIGHRADACLLSVTGFQGSSRAGGTVYRDKCDRG